MKEMTFDLFEPIITHEGDMKVLKLKYPTARTFIQHGMPFTMVREGDDDNPRTEFRFNTRTMFKFLADMTGLDEITLESIHATDVQPLFWLVTNMLSSRPTKSST